MKSFVLCLTLLALLLSFSAPADACPVALRAQVVVDDHCPVQLNAAPVVFAPQVQYYAAPETAAVVVPEVRYYVEQRQFVQADHCNVQFIQQQRQHVKRDFPTPVRDAAQNLRDRRQDRLDQKAIRQLNQGHHH